ncbi:hypothetical protein H5410_064784, partial [Solanum commersonii]
FWRKLRSEGTSRGLLQILKIHSISVTTVCGLNFLDSLIRKLNEMPKFESDLDFLIKPLLDNLEKELSTLISILEKELSFLSSIFSNVAKVHHEHKIPKYLQRRTINLAYEDEVAIDSILAHYNDDRDVVPCYMVASFKHLPTRNSNPLTDEEIVGFENDTKKIQYLIKGTNELNVIPIVGMEGQKCND